MEQGAGKEGPLLAVDCRGEGPAVVLLHGQPGSSADWNRVVPLLSASHQVIVPDRPGYGRTAGRATGFTGNASAVASTLRHLGVDGAVVVGHSWAGGIALAAAVHHPELVRGLVLVGSVRPGEALGLVDRMLATPALGDALSAMTIGSTALVLRNRRVRALVDRRFDGRVREVIGALEGLTGARTRAPVWRSFVSEQRRLFDELGALAPWLGAISVPTVIVSGGSDRIVPAAVGERLAAQIPGAVHRVVQGAHHLLPLDHPEDIAAAVREVEERRTDGTPG
jgi:pimeloyl-ACP methyl ester carboxylesterase